MKYYNQDGKKLKISKKDLNDLNTGACAKVSYSKNIILKEYWKETRQKDRIDPKIFALLKEIDHDHFIKLIDIYSKFSLPELCLYQLKKYPFTVEGYTAKYYQEETINILEEPLDYLMYNLYELEKLFDLFTTNAIQTEDVKRKNAVFYEKRIIIIDPDFYCLSSLDKDELSIKNKQKLLNLLRSLCIDAAFTSGVYGTIISKLDQDLMQVDVNAHTEITHEISKKLRYQKKPLDYFLK